MTKNTQVAFMLLQHVLPKHDRDNLYNNFEMLYESELQESGRFHAQFWLWGQILRSLPGLISAVIYWRYTMFKNYLKIALRNMARNKLYSILNVSGLSIGLACFIIIGFYIIHEMSYDRFHSNAKNIYRIVKRSNLESGVVRNSANVIAYTIAYGAVNTWLQNFAYRINISFWIFALATLITFFTSFLAIVFHTLKAAYTNPMDYLRYE